MRNNLTKENLAHLFPVVCEQVKYGLQNKNGVGTVTSLHY
jgi:hypothetical protein